MNLAALLVGEVRERDAGGGIVPGKNAGHQFRKKLLTFGGDVDRLRRTAALHRLRKLFPGIPSERKCVRHGSYIIFSTWNQKGGRDRLESVSSTAFLQIANRAEGIEQRSHAAR